MATASAIHAALVTAIEAVSGLTEAALPWSLDAWPDSEFDGGFQIWPLGDDGGVVQGGGMATVLHFIVELPWRLTGAPNTAAQAAMDKVRAVRAITDLQAEGRLTWGAATYDRSPDGHVLIASVPVDVIAFLT